jgi:hypothetical protein
MVSVTVLIALLSAVPYTMATAHPPRAHPKLKAFESFLTAATAPGPGRSFGGIAAMAIDDKGMSGIHSISL